MAHRRDPIGPDRPDQTARPGHPGRPGFRDSVGGMRRPLAALLLGLILAGMHGWAEEHPEPLAIGSPAPDFTLPAVDGRTYSLADFKNAKVLVVIFTAVHCPTAEIYEQRIHQIVDDYTPKGVAFVVIQPNSVKALRLDEMGYTDVGDTLDDMKVRSTFRKFNYPFLY